MARSVVVRRGLIAVAVVVAMILGTGGCSRSSPEFCAGGVSTFVVYNYYADHPIADVQTVTDPEVISFQCEYGWYPQAQLKHRKFRDQELEHGRVTVLELTSPSGAVRRVWIYRLAQKNASVAIIFDDGTSYFMPNEGPPPYYGPTSTPIDRSQVPRR